MRKRLPATAVAAGAACALTLSLTGTHAFAAETTVEYTKIEQGAMEAVEASSVEKTGEGSNGALDLILDSNPDTYWHTKWSDGKDPLPHWFVVKLADKAVPLARVDLLPRQSSNGSGRVHEYSIYAVDTDDCNAAAFESTDPVKTGSVDAGQGTNNQEITFDPVQANCVKVQYESSWGGDSSAETVASLAEFNAFTGEVKAAEEPEEPAPAPEVTVPDGAKEITDDTITVRTHPDFPQVIDYRIGEKQLIGQLGDPLSKIQVDGKDYAVQVGDVSTSEDGTTVTYPLKLKDLSAVSLDVQMSVKDGTLTYKLTNIQDPDHKVGHISIPGLSLVTVTGDDPAAQVMAANTSVNRESSGDTLLNVAKDKAKAGTSYMAVAANSDLAAAFDTNAIGDNTAANTSNNTRFTYDLTVNKNQRAGHVGPATWTWRSKAIQTYDDGNGIGPDADPYVKVKVVADQNNDKKVDWQDAAIATRDIVPEVEGAEDVANNVIVRIPFNIVSQATHPFLRTLDDTKRIALATDNLGQQVLLKGYQAEGHDSAQGDYAGNYNEKAGGLKDLRTLVNEGKDWNATFGIHVNATESYSEANVFGLDLLKMPPQKAWGWMNQAYYMNNQKDLATGNVLKRLEELRKDFPKDSNLNWLYWDVYYPRGWEGVRFSEEIAKQGWRQGSEWSDALPNVNTWSHWANDEKYGGSTNKGINSKLFRMVYNSGRDTFNPDPMLGNPNTVEFEGWTGHVDYNAFIQNVWERNLPAKFLQRSQIMRWGDHEIQFEDGTKVTSPLDSIGGDEIPKNRKIEFDGATVYENGSYLLPWADGGKDRLYYWNDSGKASTWKLTNTWSGQSALTLYKLTDTGRQKISDVSVSNGSVSLPQTDKGAAYVLYPTSELPQKPEPNWGQGSNITDPGFFSGTPDAYDTEGNTSVETSNRNNKQAVLGADKAVISQELKVPAGTYSAWAWVEIQPGKTRPVTVSATGEGVSPIANQVGETGKAVTEINASSALNATASDEKLGKYFQRVPVRFKTDGKPFTFTIAAEAGDAKVAVDDLRIVEWQPPTDPNKTDKTIVFTDFEDVDDGYWPFVTGSSNKTGDARTQLARKHVPFSQSGWYGIIEDKDSTATEGGKYLDNVLDGEWSLMAHQENPGLILRTTQASVPLERGYKYRVSFDYQTAFDDDYTLFLGVDKPGDKGWSEYAADKWPLKMARGTGYKGVDRDPAGAGKAGKGTAQFKQEFTVDAKDPVYLGILNQGKYPQADLVIDNFRVERLETEPAINLDVKRVDSGDKQTLAFDVTTSVEAIQGALEDVKHSVKVPQGWSLKPVKDGVNAVKPGEKSVAHWELTLPRNAKADDIVFQPTWTENGEERTSERRFTIDPQHLTLLNPFKKLTVEGVSSEQKSGEPEPNGPASAAVDGNPNTYWHTEYSPSVAKYPHWITVRPAEAAQEGARCTITGFEYTTRGNAQNGRVKDFDLFISKDGKNWGDPVVSASLTDSTKPQVFEFDPVEGSYAKMVQKNALNGQDFGGAAEIRLGGNCKTDGSTTEPTEPGSTDEPTTEPTEPGGSEQPVPPVQTDEPGEGGNAQTPGGGATTPGKPGHKQPTGGKHGSLSRTGAQVAGWLTLAACAGVLGTGLVLARRRTQK